MAFVLQKDNIDEIENLRSKRLFTTRKLQKPVKLTIENSPNLAIIEILE
jgi:hypothetical protein